MKVYLASEPDCDEANYLGVFASLESAQVACYARKMSQMAERTQKGEETWPLPDEWARYLRHSQWESHLAYLERLQQLGTLPWDHDKPNLWAGGESHEFYIEEFEVQA
jgi:hypothetical protein